MEYMDYIEGFGVDYDISHHFFRVGLEYNSF